MDCSHGKCRAWCRGADTTCVATPASSGAAMALVYQFSNDVTDLRIARRTAATKSDVVRICLIATNFTLVLFTCQIKILQKKKHFFNFFTIFLYKNKLISCFTCKSKFNNE